MFFTPLLQGAAALLQAPTAKGLQPRKVPWTQQPQGPVQIDWSNPITRGLVVETGGHRYYGVRLIEGTVNQSTSTGANVSLANTQRGKALSFNGSQSTGAASFGNISRTDGLASASWQVLFKHDATGTGENKIFAKWGPSGSWLISTDSTTGIQAWVVAATAGNATLTYFGATSVFEATGWNNAIFVWRGGTGTGNVSLFVNGVDKSSSLFARGSGPSVMNSGVNDLQIGIANDGNPLTGKVAVARMWNRALSQNEALKLSANPFTILKPTRRLIGFTVSSATISRPNSDIVVSGWTGYTDNVNLYANIDEVTPSTADYVISPDLLATPGPIIFGLTNSLPTGTYDARFSAKRTDTIGQVRVVFRDSGGTIVGTSAWQSLTNTYTSYTLTVTATGTATQGGFEVQA